MIETILNYFEDIPAWIVALTSVVTAASAITALTPTKKDDKILNTIKKVLDFLALNVFNAKNKDAE